MGCCCCLCCLEKYVCWSVDNVCAYFIQFVIWDSRGVEHVEVSFWSWDFICSWWQWGMYQTVCRVNKDQFLFVTSTCCYDIVCQMADWTTESQQCYWIFITMWLFTLYFTRLIAIVTAVRFVIVDFKEMNEEWMFSLFFPASDCSQLLTRSKLEIDMFTCRYRYWMKSTKSRATSAVRTVEQQVCCYFAHQIAHSLSLLQ